MYQREPNATPAFKAGRIAQIEADIAEQRSAYHASAFNAASTNARLGDWTRAGRSVTSPHRTRSSRSR